MELDEPWRQPVSTLERELSRRATACRDRDEHRDRAVEIGGEAEPLRAHCIQLATATLQEQFSAVPVSLKTDPSPFEPDTQLRN